MSGALELIAVAERCVKQAADLVRQRGEERPAVWSKSETDQVTAVDLAVERLLREELRAAVPGSAIVGEELAPTAGTSVTWYVDPIDGTSNFLRGLPIAAISIGAAVDGEIVAGCVLDLFRDECFTGGPDVPLRVRSAGLRPVPGEGARPLVLTDVPLPNSTRSGEIEFLGELLARAEVRRVYSTALSLAWVAAGRADIACNLGIYPWDVAAGAALVRSVGGVFVPIGGDDVHAPGFVAARDEAPRPMTEWITGRLREIAETG
ncbi:myo-inositol-1(or 4)-monophosphatase [Herbihabitans rhizosphaerae]|uniref:inositol-phosphate phosphatase n=1 Tax=Herbihabitans rhizosphaerae TaxID=1872711 RepID=A0A4Q7KRR0_9PSEU|nr:inositol monophosphatase [Herbihabitans rhizosphaerae]RZS39096.1 myo-inositol-1(or 4)-monophosphatase [Herbihabitans rhizosphaerae]